DDLDAGLEHLRLRLELVERRRVAVDLPPVLDVRDLVRRDVERLADHVPHVPERSLADRHPDAVTGVANRRATLQPVGRLQADRADTTLADLLCHLRGHRDLRAFELDVHLERGVDLRERFGRELDVDDGSVDRDDAAVLQLGLGLGGCGHQVSAPNVEAAFSKYSSSSGSCCWSPAPLLNASAPPTISMISVVIESWRARFIRLVYVRIRSSALSVAAFIARCRRACSA